MLEIFICEDHLETRKRMESIIQNKIIVEDWPLKISLSTDDPYELFAYLKEKPHTKGIYFLDIDLGKDLNGIELGAKIRQLCIDGKIIFITTHSELLALTFRYKVEAMDYIVKDDFEQLQKKIQEDLEVAYQHYTSINKTYPDRIRIDMGTQIRYFLLNDILFFETAPVSHKVILHLTNGSVEFYGKINELKKLSPNFVSVHKSFLVNEQNIIAIDRKKRVLTFKNGETCWASARKINNLTIK